MLAPSDCRRVYASGTALEVELCGGIDEECSEANEVAFEICGMEFEGVVDDDDEEGAVWSLTAWA